MAVKRVLLYILKQMRIDGYVEEAQNIRNGKLFAKNIILLCKWPELELQPHAPRLSKSSAKLIQYPSGDDYPDSVNSDLKTLSNTLCWLPLSMWTNFTLERLITDCSIRLYSSFYS